MAGRLQNEDFKTLSELTGAGGASTQLLNDTKIYVTNASLANQLSALITSGDVHTSASFLKLGVTTDSSTTGSNAALAAATKGILRVTNASLVSISTITGMATGQNFVLINRTGAAITLVNNNVANGILTGTGSDMTVANDAAVWIAYDPTTARSQVIGGSGGSSIATPVSIANGGTGQATKTLAFNSLSPQTTKGDLISNDGTNDVRVAAGGNGKVLIADSNAVEGVRWADPALAQKYITNGDAEVGTLGWTTYADAAGSAPVDGSGGSPNVSWTRSNSSPLRGSGSFVLTKDAANRQGQGGSYDFTIDAADKAKVLQVSFDYIVSSGTFVAGNPSDRTSAGDSDLTIWIYDVTNGVLIQPSTYRLFSNSSTIASQFVSNFQTASNSTSYRIIFHCGTTSAAAYAIKFDNINVLPTTYVYGTPITDWSSYTPTFNGSPTVASVTFWSRRAGDSLQVMGAFQLTAVNASTTALTIPSGLSIDTAKVGSSRKFVLGECTRIYQTGTETSLTKHVAAYNTGFLNQIFIASTGVSQNLGQNAWNGLFVNNDWVTVEATIPIAGWSSSVQMSDNADTRVVDCVVTTTANITGTAGSAFVFPTVTKDSHGAYNSSTGVYTIPVAGDYQIHGTGLYNNVGDINCNIQVNGSFNNNLTTTDTARSKSGSMLIPNLKAGDTIKLVPDVNRNLLFSAGNYIPTLAIVKISGPESIAATENVNMKCYSTNGQSFANNTTTKVQLPTKAFDSHGGFDNITNYRYTVPTSGVYDIYCQVTLTSGTSGTIRVAYVYKNGSEVAANYINSGVSGTNGVSISYSDKAIAGDYYEFFFFHNSGGAILGDTTAQRTFMKINKVGN